jgi:rfaE bifunctional protein nucleotidyltransferase chain/domain
MILEYAELDHFVRYWKKNGSLKIVMAGGFFDLFHAGHLIYLRDAASHGDILIVEMGNDALVTESKGPSRPIFPIEQRAAIVDSLNLNVASFIIVVESLKMKWDIIRKVSPDIYVRGPDYTMETHPERELVERLGGKAIVMGGQKILGVTEIIAKIRAGNK